MQVNKKEYLGCGEHRVLNFGVILLSGHAVMLRIFSRCVQHWVQVEGCENVMGARMEYHDGDHRGYWDEGEHRVRVCAEEGEHRAPRIGIRMANPRVKT